MVEKMWHIAEEEEEINVDGDVSEEEEDESYVPKKLRLAKKHINPEAWTRKQKNQNE